MTDMGGWVGGWVEHFVIPSTDFYSAVSRTKGELASVQQQLADTQQDLAQAR
jgi:hypothetical protein